MPKPVTDTSATPVKRLRARTAISPAMIMMGATSSCTGVWNASSSACHSDPANSATASPTTSTTKMVPT